MESWAKRWRASGLEDRPVLGTVGATPPMLEEKQPPVRPSAVITLPRKGETVGVDSPAPAHSTKTNGSGGGSGGGNRSVAAETATTLKEKGNEEFKRQNFDTAVECYTRALRLDGKSAVLYVNRAMANLKRKCYADVEEDCTAAIALDPTNVKAYWRRALARQELHQLDMALADLRRALELDPKNATVIEDLAKLESKQKSAKPTKESPTVVVDSKETTSPNKATSASEGMETAPQPAVVASLPKPKRKFSPPKNSYEFERDWKVMRGDSEMIFDYFEMIPVERLPLLFQEYLDADKLWKILQMIEEIFLQRKSAAETVMFLEHLSRVKRFGMILKFLSPSQRTPITQIFQNLEREDAKQLASLAEPYGYHH